MIIWQTVKRGETPPANPRRRDWGWLCYPGFVLFWLGVSALDSPGAGGAIAFVVAVAGATLFGKSEVWK